MLQFKLMTEKDVKEAAALERRRQFDEERKKRIFDPKYRLFGVDKEALEQQICEKRKREEEEKIVEASFLEQRRQIDRTVIMLDMHEKLERQRIADEINKFRLAYQKLEDRREFDLNDPEFFKKLIPPRIHDNDPRCGPSSAQKFEGEDLGEEDRKKLQKEQLKSWLDQQVAERKSAEKERKDAEEAYKAATIARDIRATELDSMEKNCRRQIGWELSHFNKALAEERGATRKKEKQQEIEDGIVEMYNHLTSDMLLENPESSQSNFGPCRKVVTMYKGMTKEDKEIHRQILFTQIEANREKKINEERMERDWVEATNQMNVSVANLDDDIKRKIFMESKKLQEENRKLAEAQKSHKLFLDNIVYTNTPTAAYYEQFNKTTR